MVLSLANIHKELLEDTTKAFVQNFNGEVMTLEAYVKSCKPFWQTHIYSGSFNPLHAGHKAIYNRIPKWETISLYEISLQRFDKPPVTEEELAERLKQFKGYASVLVTNVAKFIEKAGICSVYPSLVFHVGADTYLRIKEHHTDMAIQGMYCQFVIYDRIMTGDQVMKLPGTLPSNCKQGKEIPDDEMKLSSSAIRVTLAK